MTSKRNQSPPAGAVFSSEQSEFPLDTRDGAEWVQSIKRHYWNRSRNEFIVNRISSLGVALPARILELGCGAGMVASRLLRAGYSVVGIDGHASLVEYAARENPNGSFFVSDFLQGSLSDWLSNLDFDVAALFDVLEHLDTPTDALQRALDSVRNGGWVVGTVPALMSLWSRHDEQIGHRIRYNRRTLTTLLSSISNCTLVEASYFNHVMVPPMYTVLWLRKQLGISTDPKTHEHPPPALINEVLHKTLRMDHSFAPLWNRLGLPGASLWFALRKNGH